MPTRHDERGSAPLLLTMAVGLMAALLAWVAEAGTEVADRARGQAVADLVALAAVVGGADAAREVAAGNGARLMSIEAAGTRVAVVVRLGSTTATAHAEDGFAGGRTAEQEG